MERNTEKLSCIVDNHRVCHEDCVFSNSTRSIEVILIEKRVEEEVKDEGIPLSKIDLYIRVTDEVFFECENMIEGFRGMFGIEDL